MVWAGSLYIHSRIALLSVLKRKKKKVEALVCCTGSKQYSNESAIISCSKDRQLTRVLVCSGNNKHKANGILTLTPLLAGIPRSRMLEIMCFVVIYIGSINCINWHVLLKQNKDTLYNRFKQVTSKCHQECPHVSNSLYCRNKVCLVTL